MTNGDKREDLAGPGVSTYEEVDKILPTDYSSILTPMETMEALFETKRYIEDGLCRELGLKMVQVPLIVTRTKFAKNSARFSRSAMDSPKRRSTAHCRRWWRSSPRCGRVGVSSSWALTEYVRRTELDGRTDAEPPTSQG